MVSWVSAIGERVVGQVSLLGAVAGFACGAVWDFLCGKHRWEKFAKGVWELGVRSLTVVMLIGFFTGLVLGLQGAYTLERFGAPSLLGPAVALSLVRELAPVLTGLVVVGQAGSSLCSELGIYRNDEQIDALKMMDISPRGFLAGAPLLASLLTFPILTSVFTLMGLYGGHVSGVEVRHLDAGVYWRGVFDAVEFADVRLGLLKGAVFGFFTTGVSVFFGYHCHKLTQERGARAVALLATRAVIVSSVIILIMDYLITGISLAW